jgi:hypothetical protein
MAKEEGGGRQKSYMTDSMDIGKGEKLKAVNA